MEKLYSKTRRAVSVLGLGFVYALFLTFFNSGAIAQSMSGNYTINQNASATSTNFRSITAAVNALRGVTRGDGGPAFSGGVTGAVTLTVASGSGPYTEQVTIPAINGTSATNTITLNGNGVAWQFNATSTSAMWVLRMNGVDYLTVKNFTIRTQNASQGWGIMIDNRSDYNNIEDNIIDISSVSSTSAQLSVGITFTGSTTASYGSTAATNGGVKGIGNVIKNNEIYGSSTNNGLYIGIALNGDMNNSGANFNTTVEGNTIRNFYIYGVYSYYYHNNITFRKNDIRRGQKPTTTTFYGIYNLYSNNVNYYENKIHQATNGSTVYYGYVYAIYNLFGTYMTSVGNYVNNYINMSGAVYGYGIMAYYGSRHNIYHNTIYWRTSDLYYVYAIYAYDYTFNAQYDIKNNIIDLDGTNMPYYVICIYYYGSNISSDRNVMPRRANATGHYIGYNNTYNQTLTDWRSNGPNFDPNSIDIRPTYKNVAAGDFEPTSIDLDGLGVGVGVTTDALGNSRSTTNPDPGMIEFNIPVNVTAINYPANICQGDIVPVQVTITNSSSLTLQNFFVQYSIDNVIRATEQFTSSLSPGASASFTFATQINNTATGSFTLRAMVRGKSPVVSRPYSVNPSPVGSTISQGSTFQGKYNSGDAIDPDIVAHGDNIRYSINPPTGFTNNQYGSQWVFDYWELVTPNGTSAGTAFGKTNPSGSNNAFGSYTPIPAQSDSTFIMRYAIRSVTNGCVAPMVSRRLFVAPRPNVIFNASSVCEGDKVQFVNNSSISSGSVDYMWKFGDGDSSVLINPAHAYSQYGTYDVELVAVSNYGYTARATTQVSVKQNPIAEFTFTNACEGSSVQFTDASIIPSGTPSYNWNFGDGGAAGTGNNPSKAYNTPGTYMVEMMVTADGCTGKSSAYVTQAPKPVADFTFSGGNCSGDALSFTNSSTISSGSNGYSWDFGDNSISTERNPKHTYNAGGSFDVTLTTTSNFGCTDAKTVSVAVEQAPIVGFNIGAICSKNDVDFTNTSVEPAGSTVAYDWQFSDGVNSTMKDVQRSFSAIGSYEVKLRAMSTNGCGGEFVRMISVDEQPTAAFYVEDVCEGGVSIFNNASTGNNGNLAYSWDFGAGNTSLDKNPTLQLSAGNYNATLTVSTPSGCTDMLSKSYSVKAIPSVNMNVTSGTRGDGTMAFTATVPANASYVWYFGDGGREAGNSGAQTSINTTYTYSTDGLFFPSLRVTAEGCTNSTSRSASVLRTSVAKLNEAGLKAWPNPSNGLVNIALDGSNELIENISIINANGQLVALSKADINGNSATLNFDQLAAGVYMVKVYSGAAVYQTRITLTK